MHEHEFILCLETHVTWEWIYLRHCLCIDNVTVLANTLQILLACYYHTRVPTTTIPHQCFEFVVHKAYMYVRLTVFKRILVLVPWKYNTLFTLNLNEPSHNSYSKAQILKSVQNRALYKEYPTAHRQHKPDTTFYYDPHPPKYVTILSKV